jgi:hypothetical protein
MIALALLFSAPLEAAVLNIVASGRRGSGAIRASGTGSLGCGLCFRVGDLASGPRPPEL